MRKILAAIILVMFGLSGALYSRLPEQIPTHWNILGQIDQYMPKPQGAFLLPTLAAIIVVLFHLAPSFFQTPKEKLQLFEREWKIIQLAILGFFAYLHAVILYISLYPRTEMMPLMFIGLGSLFILMGNYMSKIRQNHFLGVRVPWTLANEDNWNKTHRFASWTFVGAGIATLVEAVFLWYAPIVIFGSIMLAAILPIIYSYLLFKRAEHLMKYIVLALIFVGSAIVFIRGTTAEDTWLCQNGQWVMHGKPSAPMPTNSCGNNN